MSWKRLLLALGLALLIMGGDTFLLAAVSRLYRPGHPPGWMTGAIFYFLAWPVLITQHIFPRAAGDNFGGPTFLAVASGGLFDLALFTVIVYALLTWRARRKARV